MLLIPCRLVLGTRGWDSESEQHYCISMTSLVFEMVAIVARQYVVNNCL